MTWEATGRSPQLRVVFPAGDGGGLGTRSASGSHSGSLRGGPGVGVTQGMGDIQAYFLPKPLLSAPPRAGDTLHWPGVPRDAWLSQKV